MGRIILALSIWVFGILFAFILSAGSGIGLMIWSMSCLTTALGLRIVID